MTYKRAYDIISEFCFTGYKDNKKPTGELFSAIHELVCEVEKNTKLKVESKRLASDNSWLVLAKAEKEFENEDLLEENDKLKVEIEKLKAELEQSVKLPCKVGDVVKAKVVRPYNGNETIFNGKVTDIQTVIRVENYFERHINFLLSDIGETVFLLEATEQALNASNSYNLSPSEKIKRYINKNNYTWTVESLLSEYIEKYLKGYYVSHTCKDCIENCKAEFEALKGGNQ